jgi:hypothetical protein
MPVVHGTSIAIHYWQEKNGSIPEATVEVSIPGNKKIFMTVQILGISDKFTPKNIPVGTTVEELEKEQNASQI